MTRLPRSYLAVLLFLLAAAGMLYLFLPWHGSLRRFNPDELAAQETRMWRHYYEGRYVVLGYDLYQVTRTQYHLSPWAAGRIAWHTTLAARIFRQSRSRPQAEAAIGHLAKAYRLLAANTGEPFDYQEASRLDVEWWQQRREAVPPARYSNTVARMMEEIYRSHDERLHQAAILRVEMMTYRDARRNGRMTPADWQFIEQNLRGAYRLYWEAVQTHEGG